MTWFGWLMVALIVYGVVMYVAMIGKPRGTLTPTSAAIFMVMQGLLLVGLLTVGTGRL